MKKRLIFMLLPMAIVVSASAQTKPKNKVTPKAKTTQKATTYSKPASTERSTSVRAFSKGDNLLNIGIGIGSPFFGSGYSSSLPVNPSVSYEKGITNEISVGGQVAFASSKYKVNFPGGNYSFKENAIYIGARGSYHFNELLELDPKFDIYGGASLGYVIVNVKDNQGYSGSTGSGVGFGLFAGGKYYFANNTAVFAELGYQSLAVLNVGIAFKL
ncbi:outer membrane beta-barrel protein [Mucilaginibacter sp. KACC 22063]|uniref:outer membrane beta-barrel protein n=1 Tax=Mucilaginibacter sp. KACC 22063 TaxID=3025666 RepID=UPI00236539F4|nr:outer membrane beta-barrel protein [Mucilaginibacter sp. KACC 22063]WDF54930.1 outer membrane beta-barrel protein [Mucilaginibacter sp. KACC 22063]